MILIYFFGSNPKLLQFLKYFLYFIGTILILKKLLKTISWVGVFGYLFLYCESPETVFQHFYADRSYLLLFLLLINIFNKI